jgi:hypothetical protein
VEGGVVGAVFSERIAVLAAGLADVGFGLFFMLKINAACRENFREAGKSSRF